MHDGTVEARSEGEGNGSEFLFRLPLVAIIREHDAVNNNQSTHEAVQRRALVADDNHDAANVLPMMLKMMGNEVRTAQDGLEALETAKVLSSASPQPTLEDENELSGLPGKPPLGFRREATGLAARYAETSDGANAGFA